MTVILGIESSCDETAAALVTSDRVILSHRLAGQEAEHRPFGGVVPEIAARAHVEVLAPLIEAALADAGMHLDDVDAIAATADPGLIGGVMVGLVTAKALCHAASKPLIAVNHLEGHALSPRLADPTLGFPYLLLLVSGGHCQFLLVEAVDRFRRLGGTIDDAPGEAFDKTAKLLALPQPGGPVVEAEALQGDPRRFRFPRPLLDREGCDMSFSGLKTALLRARDTIIAEKGGITVQDRRDLCAGFQAAVAEVLAVKTARALTLAGEGVRALAVAGGVAANGMIRAGLETVAAKAGVPFLAPPLRLCTDNAAMIAWAGVERLGQSDPLDFAARPRWPLDPDAVKATGAGVKA